MERSKDEVVVEAEVVEPKVTPEPKEEETPTQEKTFKASEVEELLQTKLNEQYAKLNRKLTASGQEIAKLRKQYSQPLPKHDDMELYDGMLKAARERERDTGTTDPMVPFLTQELTRRKELSRQQEYQAQIAQQEQIISDEHDKLRQKLIDADIDPDDEMFEAVHDAIDISGMKDGKFDKAWSRFDKIMGKVKPVVKVNQSREEELEEELARIKLNKEGKAKGDTGLPTGAVRSFQDIEQAYGAGNVSYKEYIEARNKQGL